MRTNTNKKRIFSVPTLGATFIGLLILGGCQQSTKTPDVFSGYIEDTEVNVTTRIPGKITSIFVHEGDYVKADQKIAQLDNKDMLDNLSAMKRELSNIDKNRKRLEKLYAVGAISEQKLDEIETMYEVVRDKMSALQSNVNDMTITSPIAGKVNVRVLEPGQMMAPGMPVVVVTDTSISWARVNIPESYINQVHVGQILTLGTGTANVRVAAEVVQILPMADFATKVPTNLQDARDTRTFSVKMKIVSNKEQLRPGIYVYLNPDQQRV